MLLLNLSLKHKIFYMEKRNYKEGKCYKDYVVKIDDKESMSFRNKTNLLLYLKEMM